MRCKQILIRAPLMALLILTQVLHSTPVEARISNRDVDLSLAQKYVLKVDRQRFYPTSIQVRLDKL
jgi:hypothetical protein